MRSVKWTDFEIAQNPHGVDARILWESEHLQIVHITLKPGETLKKHITPVNVIFYVLEGKGIVEIGDEKQEVGPDSVIYSPSNIPNCWYNESTHTLRFLVIKASRPTGSTRVS